MRAIHVSVVRNGTHIEPKILTGSRSVDGWQEKSKCQNCEHIREITRQLKISKRDNSIFDVLISRFLTGINVKYINKLNTFNNRDKTAANINLRSTSRNGATFFLGSVCEDWLGSVRFGVWFSE
jgi:ubiquitin C-terminal hydrolase